VWGVIPAAGRGSRIQPLAFSKELLPVGSRINGGTEQPRAVSEYLAERMIAGGADKLCFVIGPGKSDILEYYGASYRDAPIAYVVQPHAGGLCDAVFRARPFLALDEPLIVGLPDTVWFPEDALTTLPNDRLAFLLFPVDEPQYFDAVAVDRTGRVQEIQVKQPDPVSRWIWGAFKMPGYVLCELERLWLARGKRDEYIGTLVNAWLEQGGEAIGLKAGSAYVDVGTLNGYRAAMSLLQSQDASPQPLRSNGHDSTHASL
jgi:glucose-1-phosphate thymidylyltransferase